MTLNWIAGSTIYSSHGKTDGNYADFEVNFLRYSSFNTTTIQVAEIASVPVRKFRGFRYLEGISKAEASG
jgi:hypothetical protein